MKKISIFKTLSPTGFFNGAAICLSMCMLPACMEDAYTLSEERINTEATLFQEGLSLPLGTTAPIRLSQLMEQLDSSSRQMFISQSGKYAFYMGDMLSLSKELSTINESLELDKIEIHERIPLHLSDVDLSELSITLPAIEPYQIELGKLIEIPDITLQKFQLDPPLAFSKNIPTIDPTQMDLHIDPVSTEGRFASLQSANVEQLYLHAQVQGKLDEAMSYDELMQYAAEHGMENIVDVKTSIDKESYHIPLSLEFPKEIKAIKDIELNESAQIELSVEMLDPFFSGSIKPSVDVDVSQFLHIKPDLNDAGTLEDHLKHDFIVTSSNSWRDVYTYDVLSLMIEEDDFVKQADGRLTLNKDAVVTAECNIDPSGLIASVRELYENREKTMKVRLEAKFINFTIDNVKMEIEPIVFSQEISIPVKIDPISLPEVVKEIEYVAFDPNYPLSLDISSSVPPALRSLQLNVEEIELLLPAGIELNHPGYNASTQTLTLFNQTPLIAPAPDSNDDYGVNLHEDIILSKIKIPTPLAGMIQYDESVTVCASAKATGIINSSDLISSQGSQIKVDITTDGEPKIDDFRIATNYYPYEIEVEPQSIYETLPEEVAKMSNVSVYPEKIDGKNPTIQIHLDYPMPETLSIIPNAEKGLHLIFPKFIVLDELGAECKDYYNPDYSEKYQSISFDDDKPLPTLIKLPIKRLDLVPELVDGTQDEYCIRGQIEMKGGMSMAGTYMTKKQLEDLKAQNEKIAISVDFPTLKPAQLAMGQYSSSFSEKITMDNLSLGEMPPMLKSIKEVGLKDVELYLNIDASSLCSVLGDIDMSLNMDISIPDIITIRESDSQQKLHVEASLNEDKQMIIGPYKVEKLDLSSIDFSQDNISLDGMEINIEGMFSLSNVDIDLGAQLDDLEVEINGWMSTSGTDKIKLDKVETVINYQMEPYRQSIDLSSFYQSLGENIELNLDIYRYSLALDVKTNLDIPVQAHLTLSPYKNGQILTEQCENQKISLKHAQSVADTSYTKLWISNRQDDCPLGYDWVKMDMPGILKAAPDSIVFSLDAGTGGDVSWTLDTDAEYVLEANYALKVPLELGADFMLTYSDTLALPDDIEPLLSLGSLGLKGTFTNSLPIQLNVDFALLDEAGNELASADGAGHQVIKAGALDGSPVDSDLYIKLGLKNREDASAVSSLKITLSLSSGGVAGAPFREDSFVQASLSAMIPDGIHLDLKDLTTQNNEE
ncbi:MAG: hypothetical protein IIX64_06190 [Bacteroidales bacterium]|nr:hypothetical protein [Bacteroidales bacterium]